MWIYFLQAGGEDGPIKIGMAKDVEKRVSVLQTGCPEKINILFSFSANASDAYEIEKRLHTKFEHIRSNGEWFKSHTFILETIKTIKEGGLIGLTKKEESESDAVQGAIGKPYNEFLKIAREQRRRGDKFLYDYVMREAKELFEDIAAGRL